MVLHLLNAAEALHFFVTIITMAIVYFFEPFIQLANLTYYGGLLAKFRSTGNDR